MAGADRGGDGDGESLHFGSNSSHESKASRFTVNPPHIAVSPDSRNTIFQRESVSSDAVLLTVTP